MRRRSTRMQSSSNIGSDGEAELDYDDDADSTESGQYGRVKLNTLLLLIKSITFITALSMHAVISVLTLRYRG